MQLNFPSAYSTFEGNSKFNVGVKLLPHPRGFREVCWTRPPVYEILFHENFCWTGQTTGAGKVI